MNWSNATVVVTGAGGFIGSHLTERLVALGARTRAFLRYNSTSSRGWLEGSPHASGIDFVFGDVRDAASVRSVMQGADIVFHLAALIGIPYSYAAPVSYVRTNVEGTTNVLLAALEANARLVVHTSTSEVYGSARHIPIDEEHPLQAQSPYAASKIAADKFAEGFHRSFGLPVVTVRPFNTFGPRQSVRAIIPTIILQALGGQEVRLGRLDPTRDLNYVADTVDGFVRAAEAPSAVGRVLNIGSGTEVSIGDLAATILRDMNVELPIRADERRMRPQKSEVERLCAANGQARSVLGWQPRTSLDDGLAQTIEWFRANRHRYAPDAYAI